MKSFKNEITAYVLKNALEFKKADPSKVLPKLFQHNLEKKDIKFIMPEIIKIVKEINTLSLEERKKLFSQYKHYIKEREEQSHNLAELLNPSSTMVFRIAPFPSGAIHIGNAKTFLLNALYAEKYNAKLLLVMDDTIGSEKKPLLKEAYALIEDALSWLKINYQRPVIYKSDRLDTYYQYAIELIQKNKAYVCHCTQETLKKNREQGKECSCRNKKQTEQLANWKTMFTTPTGTAVLRIKTSMQHPNPAFRDRVLFKISDRPHPRVGKKYRVWPTLEMSWAIDDHLLNITHIIRGSDLQIETEMEKYIWDIFAWKHPETIHTGLVTVKGIATKISKSKAQHEVKSGTFHGWDDPRTWSIQSLRHRGIQPEALRQFIKDIGLNAHDISIPIDALYAINRKIIDANAPRVSFIESPLKLEIKNLPQTEDFKQLNIPIHPNKKETLPITLNNIHIAKKDAINYLGKEIRLLHFCNIKLSNTLNKTKIDATFLSKENKDIPKINWVTSPIACEILMPNAQITKGLIESTIKRLKNPGILQLERYGFVTFDKSEKRGSRETIKLWFAHH